MPGDLRMKFSWRYRGRPQPNCWLAVCLSALADSGDLSPCALKGDPWRGMPQSVEDAQKAATTARPGRRATHETRAGMIDAHGIGGMGGNFLPWDCKCARRAIVPRHGPTNAVAGRCR